MEALRSPTVAIPPSAATFRLWVTASFCFAEGRCIAPQRNGDLGGGAAIRRGDVTQAIREFRHRSHTIFAGCALLVQQRDLLKHPHEVNLGLDCLGSRRFPGDVESAFGTCHAVRALVEEVVSAKAMAEIIEAPRLAGSRCPIPDGILINQNLEGAHGSLAISGALDSTQQLDRVDSSSMLRRCARRVPKPSLKLKERQAWLRSEEHTSELQSHLNLVCRLLLEKKKKK